MQVDAANNNYGVFLLNDSFNSKLLESEIQIKKIEKNKYSYSRVSKEICFNKIFTSKLDKISIEIAPILPQNIPDKITPYTMLKFDQILQIEKQSKIKFDVIIPVEVGVFASLEERHSLIECFSLDPLTSRYGMYGSPDQGILCKCFRTSLKKEKQEPLVNSKISINFENETDEDISISKLVFLSTNHDIFYNSDDVIVDGINCIIKKTLGSEFAEINSQNMQLPSTFTVSPKIDKKTSEQFIMDRGFT